MSKVSKHDVAVRMLRSRVMSEQDYGRRQIVGEIENLKYKLDAALKAVKHREHVDAHLIANAAMLTEAIARWNTSLELDPIVDAIELDGDS